MLSNQVLIVSSCLLIVMCAGCATIVYSQSYFHGNRTVLRQGKYHKFQEHVDTVGKLSVGSLKVLRIQGIQHSSFLIADD